MKRKIYLLGLLTLAFLVACDVSSTEEAIQQAAETVGEVAEQVGENAEEIAEQVEETVEEVVEIVENLECSDALGCVEVDAGDPIIIAYMLPTSGPVAFLGEDQKGGVEIAIDDRGGELLGHEIELTGEDSLCSAEGGQSAAQKIAADDSIAGIIGTACSSAATAALPIISESGLSMISSSNTAPTLTDADQAAGGVWQPGYYRTAHNDLFQGRVAAEFAFNELGARTLATVHDGSPYADGLQAVMADVFVELGGEVTFQGAVNVGDTDMRPILTEIASNAPDLLYFPIFEPEAPLMVAQSTEVSGLEDTILFGADAALVDSFPENAGAPAAGMYLSGPYVVPEGAYGDLLAKWDAKFGGAPPSGFHGHAYDGANMLMDAIEAVAQSDADGNLLIGRQAIRDYISGISGYTGTIGQLSCNATGDCATGEALGVYQITEAEIGGAWPPAVIYTPGAGVIEAAAAAMDDGEEMMDSDVTPGGTLVIGSTQVPRHLNPAVQSGTATAVPGTQLFASPLRYDENWNPQPYLAESWSIADDGLSVTLNLVEGATFHDGEAITSEDVKFSIETVKANHPFSTMYGPVTSVDTPDDTTVVINLEHPHPAILLAMSSALLPVIPEHIYNDGQDMKTHPRNNEDVIGSGPFKLGEYVPGESIILEKYEDFFIDGRPYLDRIVIKINPDNSSLILEMENGDIDMMPFMTQSRDIVRMTENPDINITDQGYAAVGAINWLAFNHRDEILSNKDVRQAIAYATDREFITQALHGGVSQPQYGPITASSPFATADIEHYDLDLDKANELLDAAGYPADGDGTRFSLTVDFIPGPAEQQQNVAEYLKSQLAEVGIDIEVRAAPDFPTWAGRVSGNDFDLTMDVLFNWGDPVIGVHRSYLSTNIVDGVIWSNTQAYANDRVDELLDLAGKATDDGDRAEFYREFQEIVADELPVYWINSLPYHTASSLRVQNVPVSIWGTMAPMDEVYLDQ